MTKMVWSIYKDTSKSFENWEECDSAFFFDRDIIIAHPENRLKFFEDGTHEVFFEGKKFSVDVINGKFDIQKVKEVVGKAVTEVGYWGCYIEGFSRRGGKFVVDIGS